MDSISPKSLSRFLSVDDALFFLGGVGVDVSKGTNAADANENSR